MVRVRACNDEHVWRSPDWSFLPDALVRYEYFERR